MVKLRHKIYEGYFYFQGPIGRDIKITVKIRWIFAQMCCAVSLVCLLIASHRTCQFWVHSEHINLRKTIEFPAKCEMRAVIQFLYSEQAKRNIVIRHCPSWQYSATQLQQRGFCSVFGGKCLITHHTARLGSLWFSSHSSCETVSRRTTFWHRQ